MRTVGGIMDRIQFETTYRDFLQPDTRAGTWGMLRSIDTPSGLQRPYSVVDHLGAGAFGDVFLAIDEDMGWLVALKMLRPGRLKSQTSAEFRAEQQICRQLSQSSEWIIDWRHDGVFRSATGEERPFLAMDYVNGRTLQDLLRTWRRLPQMEVLRIAIEICKGLEVLHQHSPPVLHRDLKPGNILLDPKSRGEVRIADLGVAVYLNSQSTAPVAGTPAYMAPEKLLHGSDSIQTELYALGVIVYELLTGKRPWDVTDIVEGMWGTPTPEQRRRKDILVARWTATLPIMPQLIIPGIDPRLAELCLRLLQPEPPDRPASAAIVRTAFQRILQDVSNAGEVFVPTDWPQASSIEIAEQVRQLSSSRLHVSPFWLNSQSGLIAGYAEIVRLSLEIHERVSDSRMQIQRMLISLKITWESDFGTLGGKEARKTVVQIFNSVTAYAKAQADISLNLQRFQATLNDWISSTTAFHDRCLLAIENVDSRSFERVLLECRTDLIQIERRCAGLYNLASDRLLVELVKP